MERLTERINGKLTIKKQFPTIQDTIDVLMDRLATYEDTELEPEEIKKYFEGYIKETNRLRDIVTKYDVLKYQERLIILPCKIGDIVYTISYVGRCDVCNKNNQNDCRYSKKENFDKVECAKSLIKIQELKFEYTMLSMFDLKLKRNLYLTKEEAEKELERLKGAEVEQ